MFPSYTDSGSMKAGPVVFSLRTVGFAMRLAEVMLISAAISADAFGAGPRIRFQEDSCSLAGCVCCGSNVGHCGWDLNVAWEGGGSAC